MKSRRGGVKPGTFPLREGNKVAMMVNGREIFPPMLSAIREAERNICLETFIYWDGEVGAEFAEALAQRARDGLDVRVILDWVGCYPMSEKLIETMKKGGVKILEFRPLRRYSVGRFNHRTHRKIMTVDGDTGFIGGVGIADEWSGDARDENHWRDNHYQLQGPVVGDLQEVFFSHWDSDEGPERNDFAFYPAPERKGTVDAKMIAAEPSDGPVRVRDAFVELIDRTQKRLAIVTPYFMPGKVLLTAIHRARERGVSCQVLTCGVKTDRDVVRWASRHRWGELLRDGVEIYEYEPTLIHVKTLIGDQDEVMVGSANFDCRSTKLNSEANLLLKNEELATLHWERFDADLERSHSIEYTAWKKRGTGEKALDWFSHLFRDQL